MLTQRGKRSRNALTATTIKGPSCSTIAGKALGGTNAQRRWLIVLRPYFGRSVITRLVRGAGAGGGWRILGHTQPQMTYRYVNADESPAKRAAEILDTFTSEHSEAERK